MWRSSVCVIPSPLPHAREEGARLPLHRLVETLLTATQGGVDQRAPAPVRRPAPALSAVRRSGAERLDRRANCLQRCAPSGAKRLISRDDRPLNPRRSFFFWNRKSPGVLFVFVIL